MFFVLIEENKKVQSHVFALKDLAHPVELKRGILPAHVMSWLSEFDRFRKSVTELDRLQYPVGLKSARGIAEASFSCLNKAATSLSLAELERIEAIRPVDVTARHEGRCKLLGTLKIERQAASVALLTSFEESTLLPTLSTSRNAPIMTPSVNSPQKECDDVVATGLRVQALFESLKECETRLISLRYDSTTLLFSSKKFEALEESVACLSSIESELFNIVFDEPGPLFLGKEKVRLLRHSFSMAHVKRSKFLKRRQEEIMQYFAMLDEKCCRLEKAVAAFSQVEGILARADSSFKQLQIAKKKLEFVEKGLEIGEKTEADVEAAKTGVGSARQSYNTAVSDLLELRLLGYPELKCAAASSNDRFKDVPRITFDEMESLAPRMLISKSGAFADVYRVELPVSGACAFKELRLPVAEATLLKEASAMWDLRHHPNIVKILKVCVDPGHQGLLLELMERGSLGDLLRKREKMSDLQKMQILHDVASGLAYMHEHGQVHMDIKADNVLLTETGAKLADFGASKMIRDTIVVGTMVREMSPRWSAPEVLESAAISPKCDVWSFGMLVYEIESGGKFPYHTVPDVKVTSAILGGEMPDCKDALALKCWKKDPKQRPCATELLAAIPVNHKCLACFDPFPLAGGALCGLETCFVCTACLRREMTERLSVGVRTDGQLECRMCRKGFFDVKRHANVDLLKLWQEAQFRARESELRKDFRLELEEVKKKWETEHAVTQSAIASMTKQCPKCKLGWAEPINCNHVTCHKGPAGGCGYEFCWLCLCDFEEVRRLGNRAHAKSCRLYSI